MYYLHVIGNHFSFVLLCLPYNLWHICIDKLMRKVEDKHKNTTSLSMERNLYKPLKNIIWKNKYIHTEATNAFYSHRTLAENLEAFNWVKTASNFCHCFLIYLGFLNDCTYFRLFLLLGDSSLILRRKIEYINLINKSLRQKKKHTF